MRNAARSARNLLLRFTPRPSRTEMLRRVRLQLLLHRRWAYLRYLHMREGLLAAGNIQSVLVVGCGRGVAEVALAIEFPHIWFHLTDIESERTPNYKQAQRLVTAWSLRNVTFGILDILARQRQNQFDLVASVEVLEHIDDDDSAAVAMRTLASRYVFALVPFADEVSNRDTMRRQQAWERHEHYRVGYDAEALRRLFPDVIVARGCYWSDTGVQLRRRLQNASDDDICEDLDELLYLAQRDVRKAVPDTLQDGLGIWMVAAA